MDTQRLEQLVGAKALHLAGLVMVFVGTGYFLKVAFDRNWIEAPERVALGLAAGAGLVVYAQFLARRSAFFADGITALGAAIVMLSLWAAGPLFQLMAPGIVFACMGATAAALVLLGWRHRSERLGILAAIAGFASPLLLGTPAGGDWTLAGYLALLSAGLLSLGHALDSKVLAPAALSGSLAYAAMHYGTGLADPLASSAMLALLYLPFALSGWAAETRSASPVPRSVAMIACAVFAGLAFGRLHDGHRVALSIGLFAAGAAQVAVALATRSVRPLYAAVIPFALAVPAGLDRAAAVAGWGFEAVAFALAGALLRDPALRVAGCVLLVVGAAASAEIADSAIAATAFWNERFVSLATVAASAFGVDGASALAPFRNRADHILSRALRFCTHAFVLWALTAEAAAFSTASSVSILWALYGSALIVAGLRKADAVLRWEGLALVAAAAVKVLCFDLASLSLEYRMLSGFAVGIVLIAVSWLYQRRGAERAA